MVLELPEFAELLVTNRTGAVSFFTPLLQVYVANVGGNVVTVQELLSAKLALSKILQ